METLDKRKVTEGITHHYQALASAVPLRAIRSEAEYSRAVEALNTLLDADGADEEHALAGLVHVLGLLIAEYEQANMAKANVSPIDMLLFLMDQHQLRQSDLPEIGSQGVVSEVLNGKRALNVRQVKALAKRFSIPVSALM